MLILINQEVIDIGDPLETLQECGVADGRLHPLGQLVRLGQEAAFRAKGIENAYPGIRRALAAMIGVSGQANCALFLVPPRARAASEVAVRFGQAPITTLAFLLSAQDSGKLTPALINQQVWSTCAA